MSIVKPNCFEKTNRSVGLFLFSFFEPQSLLKAIHRLAANGWCFAKLPKRKVK
jgi:hypothetical protein